MTNFGVDFADQQEQYTRADVLFFIIQGSVAMAKLDNHEEKKSAQRLEIRYLGKVSKETKGGAGFRADYSIFGRTGDIP